MAPLATPRLRGGFQMSYTSSIETGAGERLQPSWIVNLTLTTWNLPHHVDLAGSLYNLFDRRASYPVSTEHVQGSVPQYGRRASIRLTWRLDPGR
jgi:outer membrane receptor protein involved in Fe transport